jgi:hypothetical protein
MLRFSLLDWAVWPAVCHGQAVGSDPDALCKGQGQVDGAEVPPVKDVPLMVRRRLSLAGKLAFRVSYDLAASASDRFVFSSRYGDCNQTATIVADIAERNPVSPMAFRTSRPIPQLRPDLRRFVLGSPKLFAKPWMRPRTMFCLCIMTFRYLIFTRTRPGQRGLLSLWGFACGRKARGRRCLCTPMQTVLPLRRAEPKASVIF